MMKLLKKIMTAVCVLSVLCLLAGCARKGEPLAVSPMDQASAVGILHGIANMDDASSEQMLLMEEEDIEDFFKQYGYSLDGDTFINGLNGFRDAVEAMGGLASIEDPVMSSTEDEIIATFTIKGIERDATSVVVMDSRQKITSITTNAHYTTGENITKAALNTLLGMGTTFVILIFLSIIIGLFKFIPELQAKYEKKSAPPAAPVVDKAISQIIEKEEQVSALDDGELIAVISAAIAAYQADTAVGSASGDGFVVRSIRRR